ncbi:hypothetical protein EUTSA_v10028974mg [Eutrema salsugineum]|uniref:DNA-directed RNA polymerase III subunit n=1 Tax=Eutrema salsugineum TaxID=72664 RepID=V4L2D1_EUTSA|nr:ribosomal L1 domain-containing protein CG13096 isoform X2 [Eutrema salsugineum]ESQ37809.1 hypothetical protein EUTSA_v10028974mg [Eutrema salsugineum]
MDYRRGGRGRRGGLGGSGSEYAKAKKFVIFPENTLPDPKSISYDSQLLSSYFSFQKFWRNSPYHLGDGVSKKEKESLDIERFSDSVKPKRKSNKSGSFYDYLVLRADNFPKELLGDTRRERPVKRAKWTQDADLQKLDVFERLEAKYKTEGKEEIEEGEDDDEVVESEGEESDNGDYDQNHDFDDDDDYNQADDGDYEDVY